MKFKSNDNYDGMHEDFSCVELVNAFVDQQLAFAEKESTKAVIKTAIEALVGKKQVKGDDLCETFNHMQSDLINSMRSAVSSVINYVEHYKHVKHYVRNFPIVTRDGFTIV